MRLLCGLRGHRRHFRAIHNLLGVVEFRCRCGASEEFLDTDPPPC